jgi:hypothetical protein
MAQMESMGGAGHKIDLSTRKKGHLRYSHAFEKNKNKTKQTIYLIFDF